MFMQKQVVQQRYRPIENSMNKSKPDYQAGPYRMDVKQLARRNNLTS